MNDGLSGIKNIIWAFAIIVASAALLIGLIVTMVLGFNGQRQDGTMYLQTKQDSSSSQSSEPLSGGDAGAQTGGLKLLPDSQDTGLEYLFKLTFLCDNSFSAVSSYGSNFGSTASAQVWLSADGQFPAAKASKTKLIYPQTGSSISPKDAAKAYQPSRLVIYIGGDQLASATEEDFVKGYTELIEDLQSASPGSSIVVCSLGSVSPSYSGSDGLDADSFNKAQLWIQQVASNTCVYFADLASVLNDENGSLKAEYANADGRSLNAQAISAVMDYFRMHGF